MKITAISDTHCCSLPKLLGDRVSDLLIIAGDVLMAGTSTEWYGFLCDLETIRGQFTNIVFTPGNHDIWVEKNIPLVRKALRLLNVMFALDEMKIIGDKKFYFSPWIPTIGVKGRWAFEKNRGDELAEVWKKIPSGLDVLVTHGPPYKILDWEEGWRETHHWGSIELNERLATLKRPPKVHIFGHVHRQVAGMDKSLGGKTDYYNVSILNNAYIPTWEPTEILI